MVLTWRLIAALRANPGLTVGALADAADESRSGTGERLRQLAARGWVEKDRAGRWRLTV
jgi:DNA-binding IclR family transcriptional regulator